MAAVLGRQLAETTRCTAAGRSSSPVMRLDARALAEEHAHTDHAVVADGKPSTTSERAPMKQWSSMIVGWPAAAPARRRCRRRRTGGGAYRSARRTDRRPGIDHRALADVRADVHSSASAPRRPPTWLPRAPPRRAPPACAAELAEIGLVKAGEARRDLVPRTPDRPRQFHLLRAEIQAAPAFFSHSLTPARRCPSRARPRKALLKTGDGAIDRPGWSRLDFLRVSIAQRSGRFRSRSAAPRFPPRAASLFLRGRRLVSVAVFFRGLAGSSASPSGRPAARRAIPGRWGRRATAVDARR